MPARLRLFPLNAVLFPGAALNLHVFEPRYKQLIAECLENGEGFGVVLIREGNETGDPTVEPHQVGSIAEIVDVKQLPFGRFYLSTIGRGRFRIRRILSRDPFLTVEADLLPEARIDPAQTAALHGRVLELFRQYVELLAQFTAEPPAIDLPPDATGASYIVADALQVADALKQHLLEIDGTKQRLTKELEFLRRLLPQMQTLVERREAELQARAERGEDDAQRGEQKKYFGKYFSSN